MHGRQRPEAARRTRQSGRRASVQRSRSRADIHAPAVPGLCTARVGASSRKSAAYCLSASHQRAWCSRSSQDRCRIRNGTGARQGVGACLGILDSRIQGRIGCGACAGDALAQQGGSQARQWWLGRAPPADSPAGPHTQYWWTPGKRLFMVVGDISRTWAEKLCGCHTAAFGTFPVVHCILG